MHFLSSIKSVFPSRKKQANNLPGPAKRSLKYDPNLNGPFNDVLPPLRPIELPRILPEHRYALADQGWTKVTFHSPQDNLQGTSQALFDASKSFFDLPSSRKEEFKTKAGSEEGWNCVKGEKEFITLRSLEKTPAELKDAAQAYWDVAGSFLDELLKRVAESLGLPGKALGVYSEPCAKLGIDRTATMLRLFRYESSEADETKMVAEPHRDLGLISLVLGDKPGLECWDRHNQSWFPIEMTYNSPSGSVMVGRQLERLSNMRYRAGGHLVRSYQQSDLQNCPSPFSESPYYRYSIVFVLRAHSSVPVNTDELTSSITGRFKNPMSGITAGNLFKELHEGHFNINTGVEEREKQRQKLAEKRANTAPPVTNG